MWDYGYQRFEMGYASAIATILFLLMLFSRRLINILLERVGR
jgi:multiple sugar transport system permease protein